MGYDNKVPFSSYTYLKCDFITKPCFTGMFYAIHYEPPHLFWVRSFYLFSLDVGKEILESPRKVALKSLLKQNEHFICEMYTCTKKEQLYKIPLGS